MNVVRQRKIKLERARRYHFHNIYDVTHEMNRRNDNDENKGGGELFMVQTFSLREASMRNNTIRMNKWQVSHYKTRMISKDL